MSVRVVGIASFFFFLWLVFVSVTAQADRAAAPLRAWDDIVSAKLFSDISDFERSIHQDAGERVYTYLALDKTGRLLLSVAVAIAPVGSRLSPAEWQAGFTAADATARARDFPDIGARARVETPRFSPDGALSGVIFTTSDGFFDVAVSVLEESSSSVRPSVDAETAARRINAAYDDTRK